jgi:hypothetical protein
MTDRPTEGLVPLDLLPLGPDGRPLSQRSRLRFPPRRTNWRRRPRAAIPAAAAAPRGGTRRFVQEHQAILIVVLVATLARGIAMLGYPPALWYPDSLPYVHASLHVAPYQIRPVGYSFMLLALKSVHSFVLVVLVQHAMGIATGVAVYALLRRRYGLPGWAATLAAIPPLLSVYAIAIEHFVLSDTLFGFLVTMAVVLMLWWPVPPVWVCAVTGLLLSGAALARSEGLPLIASFCVYLFFRMRNIRVIAGFLVMCLAFAAPMYGYARWFEKTYGTFQLTTSTGMFLYGRVSSFADCAIIKPPVSERWLCLNVPVNDRMPATYYVWSSDSPMQHGPGQEFDIAVNRLATDFDKRAILAQPFSYLEAVLYSAAQSFWPTSSTQAQYLFPDRQPQSLKDLAAPNFENPHDGYSYGHDNPSTKLVAPFATWTRVYQRFAVLPGWLLAIIMLSGTAGVGVSWRRLGGPTLLPWLTGVVLLLYPAATAGFSSRYVIASIPTLCIAAALGLKQVSDYAKLPRTRPSAAVTPDRLGMPRPV